MGIDGNILWICKETMLYVVVSVLVSYKRLRCREWCVKLWVEVCLLTQDDHVVYYVEVLINIDPKHGAIQTQTTMRKGKEGEMILPYLISRYQMKGKTIFLMPISTSEFLSSQNRATNIHFYIPIYLSVTLTMIGAGRCFFFESGGWYFFRMLHFINSCTFMCTSILTTCHHVTMCHEYILIPSKFLLSNSECTNV